MSFGAISGAKTFSGPSRAANRAAIGVILLAGILSSAWAFIVPIFQATDEAAHFDYAISIFSARRLIPTSGVQTAWIVSPYTRYLLRATDYFRIAFHSSMRAPHGYGTFAYYRHVDAGAPSVTDPIAVQGRVSYIAPSYPFGFYVLEAAWMKAIAMATGSLTAMFFGARLLCVFLMMAGLYCSYRIALNLGMHPWLAVVSVAAVGFFPLTTLVSSYVQPDNLAFALVSASLLFATQARDKTTAPFTVAALGVCLGLLAVTKYHFFLSAAIPIVALVVVRLWHERPVLTSAASRIALLVLPAVALLAVQLLLVPPKYTPPAGSPRLAGILGSFPDILRSGVEPTIVYLGSNAAKAFIDFFVTGANAATYWGELGLWDAPLVIVNEHVELALRVLIALASIAAALAVGYRILHNSFRLSRMAFRGRRARAALIATSDPVLGSYTLFFVFMFALYVVSADVYGAAGRQWYPYAFVAFLCAAWYAPRTLRRCRARGPILAATAIAIYSFVASAYATAAVLHRYYGPRDASYTSIVPASTQVVRGHALGFLWPIQGIDFHPLATREFRTSFARGARLWVGGAAIFPQARAAAQSVAVVVDGRIAATTISALYNFQIAEATRSLTYGYSGFYATFGTEHMGEGVHAVRAYAKLPQQARYQEILPPQIFFLTPGYRFSDGFLQRLQAAPRRDGYLENIERCAESLLLARGVTSAPDPVHRSVVWLLVDGTPYPARYGADGRSFSGTIRTFDLKPGFHWVSAFVADTHDARYWRIPGRREFITARGERAFHLTWAADAAPTECKGLQ